MNDISAASSGTFASSSNIAVGGASRLVSNVSSSLTQFALRVALATPFFNSGLTKWDGFFQNSDSAVYLFAEEFRLHIFGHEYAYPFPQTIAFLTGAAEIILPILLVLGLGARLAAFGILALTAVIQITVPDGWANFHLPWAAMALAILAYGPGGLSFDRLISLTRRSIMKRNSILGERRRPN
jgi:putative oxidoreductase